MKYEFLDRFRNEDMDVPETLEEAKMTLKVIDDSLLDIVDVDDDVRKRIGFNMETYKKGLLNIYTNLEALKVFVEIELDALDDIAEDGDDDENESYRTSVEDFEDDIYDTEQVFEMACMLTDESYSLPRISEVQYDQYGRPHAIVEPSPADIIAEWVFKRRPKS